jgi:hypothetical protein
MQRLFVKDSRNTGKAGLDAGCGVGRMGRMAVLGNVCCAGREVISPKG